MTTIIDIPTQFADAERSDALESNLHSLLDSIIALDPTAPGAMATLAEIGNIHDREQLDTDCAQVVRTLMPFEQGQHRGDA